MMDKIVIGSEKQIQNYIRKLPVDAEWKWCYFGIKIDRKEGLSRILTNTRRYYYADELYKLSRGLKQPFLDWMSRINSRHQNDIKWWATRFASKSPFQTDFFMLFCYFNLVDMWVSDREIRNWGLLVIVVEDAYLHQLLEKRSPEYNNYKVQVEPAIFRVALSGFYYWMKSLLVPFIHLYRQLLTALINVYLKFEFKNRFGSSFKLHEEVLLSTYIEKRSFRNSGFNDHYLGPLAGFYEKNGNIVAISAQINLPVFLKKKALTYGPNFLFPDFYLKTNDWLKVLFIRPLGRITKEVIIFRGFDYAPLFAREFNRERSSLSFYSNLCEYYAFKNYFADNSCLRLFVYPFENQPWEKMVLLALKLVNPKCVCAGYQHTTVPSMLMNYFLGEDEYKYAPVPDYLITNGVYHEKLMERAGYKSTKIVNGGSLRYKNEFYKRSNASSKRSAEAMNILILLTSSLPYSLEIIYSINSIRGMFCPKGNCKLFVRPHPDLYSKKIEKAIREIGNFEVIKSGSMDEVLANMDVVVYSTTTAALEAFYTGLPVYKVATELIDLDVLEDLNLIKHRVADNVPAYLRMFYFCYDNKVEASFNNIIGEPLRKDTWLSLLMVKNTIHGIKQSVEN